LALRSIAAKAEWQFDPGSPDAAEQVRSELRRALELYARVDALECLDMIYAELVSNAIRHAPGVIEMRIECVRIGGDIVLHMLDRGPGYRAASRLPADLMSETGRGLFIISIFSERMTVKRRTGGGSHTRVSFRPARGD
jgi:anti-sigma regulatory factor (Ser/Thr protein kinase)